LALDLHSLSPAYAGLDIAITATRDGGDGLVNVGTIFAKGLDLGAVTIQGSALGVIAGSAAPGATGIQGLALLNLGRFDDYTQYFYPGLGNGGFGQGSVTDLNSAGVAVSGLLGSVTVNGDVNHARVRATQVGDVVIHGGISPTDSEGTDS